MYALIRQYHGLDAQTRKTATRKASDELRPLLSKTPGFVSYELLEADGADAAVTSISVFDTREHADASSTIAQDWVRTNLPSMPAPHNVAGELLAH